MDFNNRSTAHSNAARPNSSTDVASKKDSSQWPRPTWLRLVWIILLFSVTALLVLLVILLYVGNPKESSYVDKDRQQAVFLTNGQVYFGKVKKINSRFVELRNIYYLNVKQQVQPEQDDAVQQSNVQLVKLGCELHGPVDQMIINRDQVTFWENLRDKDDSRVTAAIEKWVAENPNGQECEAPSTQTDSDSSKTKTP